MTEHFILEIKETRISCSDPEWYDPEQYRSESTIYRISTRKLDAWLETHEFEYGYVSRIVERARAGGKYGYGDASRKYSFGDTPSWWRDLIPDNDCTDPVRPFEYDVVVS
jgi:hypothetical protein